MVISISFHAEFSRALAALEMRAGPYANFGLELRDLPTCESHLLDSRSGVRPSKFLPKGRTRSKFYRQQPDGPGSNARLCSFVQLRLKPIRSDCA